MSLELRKSDSGTYRQTIRINQHTLFADVSQDLGGDNSREAQGVYVLNVQLKLLGKLTDEQKSQLAAIADKCPIHKLMTAATTEVHTSYS